VFRANSTLTRIVIYKNSISRHFQALCRVRSRDRVFLLFQRQISQKVFLVQPVPKPYITRLFVTLCVYFYVSIDRQQNELSIDVKKSIG